MIFFFEYSIHSINHYVNVISFTYIEKINEHLKKKLSIFQHMTLKNITINE